MQKVQTYQLTKSVKRGNESLVQILATTTYCGERVTLIESGTLASMLDSAQLATTEDAAIKLQCMGIDIMNVGTVGYAPINVSDVLPTYKPTDADSYIASVTPHENVVNGDSGTFAWAIMGRYYKRTKAGNIRYTAVVVSVATFGTLETHILRCNASGTVTPKLHTLASLFRLVEREVASDAHDAAQAVYGIEKQRATVTYRLAPIYEGIAAVTN